MAVLRQENWLGQQRVDIPFLRAVESAVAADFDALGQSMVSTPYIVAGFNIPIVPSPIGLPAVQILMNTANGVILHPTASESGTIFTVPANRPQEILNSATNQNVTGSFSANTTNYVGVDLVRSSDSNTSDQVQFLPANAGVANAPVSEISKVVPLARTLNYRIVVQNQTFSSTSNIAPVAIVVTDINNNVVSVEDARQMMFRLGSGSDTPNIYNKFAWSSGRSENPILFSSGSNVDPFAGGDKQLSSFKNWCDAVMTRIQEIGGGQYWYSPTQNLNIKLLRLGPTFPDGDNFQIGVSTSTNVYLAWQGLYVAYDSFLSTNDVGSTPTYANKAQITDNTSGIPSTITGTIAVASNGQTLPFPTIFVNTTFLFPTSGEITVVTGAGTQTVTYSGTSVSLGVTTSFTGCIGGTGLMSTGGAITFIAQGSLIYPGQCLYVDIDRSTITFPAVTAQIGNLDSLNVPSPPFSRFVIAWAELNTSNLVEVYARDSQFQVGVTSTIATTTAFGTVELNAPQVTGSATVASVDGNGYVIGTGVSRGAASVVGVGAGTLNIGGQAFDTSIAASVTQANSSTSVPGSFTITNTGSAGSTLTLTSLVNNGSSSASNVTTASLIANNQSGSFVGTTIAATALVEATAVQGYGFAHILGQGTISGNGRVDIEANSPNTAIINMLTHGGTINIGTPTASDAINVGNYTGSTAAGSINIGTIGTGTGTNVNIGLDSGASTLQHVNVGGNLSQILSGVGSVFGSFAFNAVNYTATNVTLPSTGCPPFVLLTAGGTQTINLPSSPVTGQIVVIKNATAGIGPITVKAGTNIDGTAGATGIIISTAYGDLRVIFVNNGGVNQWYTW